jgi:hypothetical protein
MASSLTDDANEGSDGRSARRLPAATTTAPPEQQRPEATDDSGDLTS